MIDILAKYQASIFGNFSDIQPTPDIISKVMTLFRDKSLIPGTFQEISPAAMGPQLRLRVSSPNNEWSINFAVQRIDVEKNPIDPKGQNLGTPEVFTKESCEFFARILAEFNKKSNRVALITSGLLKEMTQERLNDIYCRLFKPIDFYQGNIPFEWNSRSVARLVLKIAEQTEQVNVITGINRIQGHMMHPGGVLNFDRIETAFDINTTQDNPETRFDMNFINNFFSKAIDLRTAILVNLEELF
ncbi:MAG: hypothetical protein RKP73_19095 [Candidatus Contendobacter sp.]|nr:hypothetical protein [Candidatus Contendobacter sp.]